jgi:recombination protein RecT
MTDNALTVQRDTYVAVRQEVSDRATSELVKLLPPEKAARFVQTGLRALAKNPDLLQCTPKSLANAFYDAAVLDLEPVLGAVYFVRYGKEAVMQIGYKGLVDLAKRGDPTIEDIYGQAVYEGDEFDYAEGTEPFIRHHPDLTRKVADPTKISHFYAIAFRAGHRRPAFVVMTKSEVDDIRARSKAANNGPWVTDYPAMGMKCPVRRLCVRRLSLAAVIKEAIERDDEREYGQPTVTVSPTAKTTSLRDALAAQASSATSTDGGSVVVEVSGQLVEQDQIDGIVTAEVVESTPDVSAAQPTKCGALSDPALGEIEECDMGAGHLEVKGSRPRHRAASGSIWPAK